MDGGAWKVAVHGIAKSRTWLSDFPFTFHFHALEKVMATHSSILAWRIPGMGEPGGLPSVGSHRVRHNWSDLAAAAAAARETLNIICVCVCVAGRFSHVCVFAVLWTVTHQVPLSMGFSRQEHWSGLPFPPPGDPPNPGIEPCSHVFFIGSWVLYHERHLGSPEYNLPLDNYWIQKFPSKQTSWGMAEN